MTKEEFLGRLVRHIGKPGIVRFLSYYGIELGMQVHDSTDVSLPPELTEEDLLFCALEVELVFTE